MPFTHNPYLLNLGVAASEWWTHVNAGGANIRVTDAAGSVEYARFLTWVDVAGEDGELNIQVPSLSDSVDNTLRLWTGGSASAPAATDTYGRNNVYDGTMLGTTCDDANPGTAVVNVQGNASYDFTDVGSMDANDSVQGLWGNGSNNSAFELDGTDDGLEIANIFNTNRPFSMEALIKTAAGSDTALAFSDTSVNNIYFRFVTGATTLAQARNGATIVSANGSTSVIDNAWHHIVAAYDSSGNYQEIYIDGSSEGTETTNVTSPSSNQKFAFGFLNDSTPATYNPGQYDEVFFHYNSVRSAAWWKYRSENILTPSSSYTVGSTLKDGSGPDSTTKYVDVTIPSSKIDASLTDFVVKIRLSDIA